MKDSTRSIEFCTSNYFSKDILNRKHASVSPCLTLISNESEISFWIFTWHTTFEVAIVVNSIKVYGIGNSSITWYNFGIKILPYATQKWSKRWNVSMLCSNVIHKFDLLSLYQLEIRIGIVQLMVPHIFLCELSGCVTVFCKQSLIVWLLDGYCSPNGQLSCVYDSKVPLFWILFFMSNVYDDMQLGFL